MKGFCIHDNKEKQEQQMGAGSLHYTFLSEAGEFHTCLVCEGIYDHPSLKCNTHSNLISCPPGKINERYNVPTKMDAGVWGYAEESETAEKGQLQSCHGIHKIWHLVQHRDYPWFLFAAVLINLAAFSLQALDMSYTPVSCRNVYLTARRHLSICFCIRACLHMRLQLIKRSLPYVLYLILWSHVILYWSVCCHDPWHFPQS